MKKKTRAYSLSDDVFEAVRSEALRMSVKGGKRISESALVEKILRKKLIKKDK